VEIVIYIILVHWLVTLRLKHKYSYYRKIFNSYMPQFIILKEKRIKYWLIRNHLLNN